MSVTLTKTIVIDGLGASDFTLRETGSDSGVFEGTFSVPHEYCAP